MTKSVLAKLFTAIIVMFIVCIPELFQTLEGNSMVLSCMDACSNNNSYMFHIINISLICLMQQGDKQNVMETFVLRNQTISGINLSISQNASHGHSELFICDPEIHVHPLYQELKSQGNKTNGSLEMKGKYLLYSYKDFHFVLASAEEDKPLSAPFTLEIHIRNVTDKGENATDHVNFSPRAKTTKVPHDLIKISLHFDSYVPYYTGTFGIVWLVLILIIFASALIATAYKVVKGNKTSLTTVLPDRKNRETVYNSKKEISNPHCLQDTQHSSEDKTKQRSYAMCSLSWIPEHRDTSCK